MGIETGDMVKRTQGSSWIGLVLDIRTDPYQPYKIAWAQKSEGRYINFIIVKEDERFLGKYVVHPSVKEQFYKELIETELMDDVLGPPP